MSKAQALYLVSNLARITDLYRSQQVYLAIQKEEILEGSYLLMASNSTLVQQPLTMACHVKMIQAHVHCQLAQYATTVCKAKVLQVPLL